MGCCLSKSSSMITLPLNNESLSRCVFMDPTVITGIPTSTTHCQVMGVVGAGVARGLVDSGNIRGGLSTIDFKLIGGIALSWIVTIPFSLLLSTILHAVVRVVVIGPL